MRVYELAKELGFSSKDLVSVLKDAGIVVSSHMSMISEQDVDKARKAAKPGKPAVAKSVTAAPAAPKHTPASNAQPRISGIAAPTQDKPAPVQNKPSAPPPPRPISSTISPPPRLAPRLIPTRCGPPVAC